MSANNNLAKLDLSKFKGLQVATSTDSKKSAFNPLSTFIPCNQLEIDSDGFKVGRDRCLQGRLFGNTELGYTLEIGIIKSFDTVYPTERESKKGWTFYCNQTKAIVGPLSQDVLTADRPDLSKLADKILSYGKDKEFTLWEEKSAIYKEQVHKLSQIPSSERDKVDSFVTSAVRFGQAGNNFIIYFIYPKFSEGRAQVALDNVSFVMEKETFRKAIESFTFYQEREAFHKVGLSIQVDKGITNNVSKRNSKKACSTL